MTAPASPHFVVTGAGTGIGRAIALRLGGDGARLTLMARSEGPLRETARLLGELGAPTAHVVSADIRSEDAVDRAFASAVQAHGPLRGVIANSGIGGANEPGPSDRFGDLVQTNLVGTYHCLRAGQRHFETGPAPRHMVVIASILARIGVAGYTGYCASKAGLLGLTRAMAMELAPEGVQVNALCPGWVDTAMARQGIEAMANGMGCSFDEALAEAMKPVPLGRMSKPAHIAGMVAWLVGPDAAGVTGQALDMNNGAWM